MHSTLHTWCYLIVKCDSESTIESTGIGWIWVSHLTPKLVSSYLLDVHYHQMVWQLEILKIFQTLTINAMQCNSMKILPFGFGQVKLLHLLCLER